MRVWIVTVVHDPQDARISVRELSALLADDHEVTLVAPFTAYGRAVPDAVVGRDIARSVGRSRARAIREARRVLREAHGQADLVILHDPELLLAVWGQRRRLRGMRIMWDVHEDVPTLFSMRSWVPRWAAPPLRAVARFLVRWAERNLEIIVAEESYLGAFRRRHPVVANAVTIPTSVPPPSGNQVVYVGRVTVQRGANEMIALANELTGEARVVIIGPADQEVTQNLHDAVAEGALEWRGFVPNEEALAAIEGSIAGLSLLHDVPNYRHSLPTKLAEYGAHGVPIISTPNPSSASFVERDGAGVLVPFGDVADMAKAVRGLIANPERAAEIAASGRKTASELFDWAKASETFRNAVAGG